MLLEMWIITRSSWKLRELLDEAVVKDAQVLAK